jgi:hypothetical protein
MNAAWRRGPGVQHFDFFAKGVGGLGINLLPALGNPTKQLRKSIVQICKLQVWFLFFVQLLSLGLHSVGGNHTLAEQKHYD